MKYINICEFSQVRNRPVVYSRYEAGASVHFGHISSFSSFVRMLTTFSGILLELSSVFHIHKETFCHDLRKQLKTLTFASVDYEPRQPQSDQRICFSLPRQ